MNRLASLLSTRFEETLGELLEDAKAAGLLPGYLEAADMLRLFRVFEANVQALRAYRPGCYAGNLSLFAASERSARVNLDPADGWVRVAPSGVEVFGVPGDHYSILREPGVEVLATQMRTWFKRQPVGG
jgi:thioesterase domain-containing protein